MRLCGVDFSERLTTQWNIDWRVRMLEELGTHSARMRRDLRNERDFLEWFRGEAESIIADAPEDTRASLCKRINVLLHQTGSRAHYSP
jgi:hypothetical protein